MISKTVVQQLIDQWLEDKDYFLADLSINGDKILVEIDHAEGVWIEDCVSLSRFIEQGLDRDEEDFDLEVGSAGIGQPFKVLQQYEIHLGDEVEILTTTGKKLQGRLTAASAEEISIVQQVKVKAEGEKRPHLEEGGTAEVETPILQRIAGGASARPFITHHNSLDIDLYLRIATELYLKRLIVGGFEGVYEIGKNFRNEGMDKNHNTEFTCMELYVQYKDYNWMMSFTESLLERICIAVNGSAETVIDGKTISFKAPYRRLPILEAIREKTGYDLSGKNEDEIRAICKELKMEIDETMGKGKLIDEIFGEFCEGTFIQPTFITDYPIEMSPLTKKHRDNPALTERFELMVNGKELANAYSELNDPIDQEERFQDQLRLSEKGDDEAMFIDQDFLRALQYGMPPTSGIGIGIDRLVMLMTGQSYIQEVLLFPTMRPEKNPPRDAVSAYTAIGIPEDVVPVLQKLGYNLVSNLAEEKPQKIQQQIIELQKKYRGIVDLPRPGVEEISEWISHLHK